MLVSEDKLTSALARYGEDYTTQVFNRYQKAPANITTAVASKAPTFVDVTNFFSRESTLMWLRFHIAETFAFLGIYDTASKGQIVQTAELVLDHEVFGHMNLDEFLTFLKYFKRGDYGKIYQSARPNPQEFLSCLTPFWNDLCQHRIKVQQEEEEERQRQKMKEDAEKCISYAEWLKIKDAYHGEEDKD